MDRGRAGFTLVEVLVAFVILTGIVAAASLGLSLFLDRWGKDGMGRRDFEELRDVLLLKNAVEGIYDYYVRPSQRDETRVPYFVTWSDGFAFATASPFWHEGEVALARVVFRKSGEDYTLVYEESSLEDKYLDSLDDAVAYEHAMPILEHIRSYVVQYFGAEDLTTTGLYLEDLDYRIPVANRDVYGWYGDYNGWQRNLLPEKIAMSLTFDNGETKELLFPVRVFNLTKFFMFNPDYDIFSGR